MRGALVAPVAPAGVGPLLDGYSGRQIVLYLLLGAELDDSTG